MRGSQFILATLFLIMVGPAFAGLRYKMQTKEALQILKDLGYPIARLAKRIGYDPSTIAKWVRGQSLYLSEEAERAVRNEIRRICEQINTIRV